MGKRSSDTCSAGRGMSSLKSRVYSPHLSGPEVHCCLSISGPVALSVCVCVAGRGGEGLKLITRTTGAKVSCSREKLQGPLAKGSVTVAGTRQEVKQAKVSPSRSLARLYS